MRRNGLCRVIHIAMHCRALPKTHPSRSACTHNVLTMHLYSVEIITPYNNNACNAFHVERSSLDEPESSASLSQIMTIPRR